MVQAKIEIDAPIEAGILMVQPFIESIEIHAPHDALELLILERD